MYLSGHHSGQNVEGRIELLNAETSREGRSSTGLEVVYRHRAACAALVAVPLLFATFESTWGYDFKPSSFEA